MNSSKPRTSLPLQQTTLARWASLAGVGLHTGRPCRVRLGPAAVSTGVVFERLDLPGQPEVRARPENLAAACQCTALAEDGVRVSTVEHLLAALAGLGVDNVRVVLDTEELPMLDGSARPWVELIERAGLRVQDEARVYLQLTRAVREQAGERWLEARPARGLSLDCAVEYDHPLIHSQRCVFVHRPDAFRSALAPARTFGFLRDVERLNAAGLALGGSLDNALVLDDFSVLNPGGLRFPDEFVRHKALDLLGDLALLGAPLLGRVSACRAGHRLHHALVQRLAEEEGCLQRLSFARPGEAVAALEGLAIPNLQSA
jgi:UDP-3-O-[3-hydroxymyristoyl] N-acetylglucosamine deacetylase